MTAGVSLDARNARVRRESGLVVVQVQHAVVVGDRVGERPPARTGRLREQSGSVAPGHGVEKEMELVDQAVGEERSVPLPLT